MPAIYVERVRTYTAVQWDGSDEAATWIVANYEGATKDGDLLVVRDSMDRETPVDPDTWIVRNDATGAVSTYEPDDFAARYQLPAS